MQYPSTAYLNLAFLFFGAFLGSLLCIIAGNIFKKKYFKFRLSLTFLLLAAAIIFVVMLLFEQGKSAHGAQEILAALKTRVLVLLLYTFLGALCAAFLRSFLPVAAMLYIAFSFCLAFALYKKMPLPASITITVSETFVRDESTGKEYVYKIQKPIEIQTEEEQESTVLCSLVFDVYKLNENTLFPLPNVWYRLCGTLPNYADFSEALLSGEITEDNEPVFKATNSDGKLKKIFYGLCEKIVGAREHNYIEVPVQQVYPSLYDVKIKTESSKFKATLERII